MVVKRTTVAIDVFFLLFVFLRPSSFCPNTVTASRDRRNDRPAAVTTRVVAVAYCNAGGGGGGVVSRDVFCRPWPDDKCYHRTGVG